MILKFKIQGKDKFVPKIRGKYLEYIGNLGCHKLTDNPHVAEKFSTKAKAKNCIKEYRKIKLRWQR